MEQQERGKLRASLGASKFTPELQRIRELERELAIAKMKRDIVKIGEPYTANAFFTKKSKARFAK